MNISNKKWKFCAAVLLMSVVAGCGMTPAEKKAQREAVRKQQKLQNEVKNKQFYANLNTNFLWKKGKKIPKEHYILNYERYGQKKLYIYNNFIIEKGYGIRRWKDAMNNCENANILGLTNWRLPTPNELREFNWDLRGTGYSKEPIPGAGFSYNMPKMFAKYAWSSVSTQEGGKPAAYVLRSDRSRTTLYNSIETKLQRSTAATICIHEKGEAFPDQLESAASSIFNLKKPSKQKLTKVFPKSIDHKLKTFIQPNIGEFETTAEYHKRFSKLQKDINAHNDKLRADYDKAYKKAMAEREEEFTLMTKKYERQKAQHKVDSFKEAFFVVYGDPILTNINYNADQQVFTMNVTSQYGGFSQQLRIPLSVKYARKFKKLITAKSFSPTVELDVRNGEVFVAGIKEIADPALIVESDEFKKAKKSIKELNTFISRYPKSKYVTKAKTQIEKLQQIAEAKRLAAIELAKDNADGEIIGTKNLEGAKFIAGRIWQDQPFNSKPKALKFKQAKEYCDELTLLGTNGWRLPSRSDFEKLGKNMNKLSYRAFQTHYFSDYFTRDDNCTYRGFADVPNESCVIGVDISKNSTPYVSTADKRNSNSVRCVLSAYKYNKYAKEQERKFLNENSLDGYINAFMAAGNDTYIRKAFDLAENSDDLAKVEMALIKYFGLHNVFSLKGSLITKEGEDANRGEIDASLLLNMIASSGNAEFKYEVFPNANSTVPLKHGKYKVRLKVKLAMTYQTTMKKALFGFDLGTSDTQVKEREFEVILSPENDWKASGNVDFGTIMQGSKAGAFVFKFETKLGSIKPSFDLLSIERLE